MPRLREGTGGENRNQPEGNEKVLEWVRQSTAGDRNRWETPYRVRTDMAREERIDYLRSEVEKDGETITIGRRENTASLQ